MSFLIENIFALYLYSKKVQLIFATHLRENDTRKFG